MIDQVPVLIQTPRMFRATFLLMLVLSSSVWGETFRFHLLAEPHSLDPQTTASNSGNYLFQNIFRGLYRYHSQKGLILEGAKSCQRAHLRLTCKLNTEHRWSNGEPIVAEDYVRAFRRMADPEQKSPQVESILTLRNARAVLAGEKKPETLGVSALDTTTLRFDFAEDDPEFEYKLTNVATSPWPKTGTRAREKSVELITSGPYKITSWKSGERVRLEPNNFYGLPAAAARPSLEAYFIDDDSTALRLYEAGKLDFLRRLSYGEIPRFQNSPQFHQFQVSRFDYIGFGEPLNHLPKVREALARSIDFMTYKALVDNKGLPGCPGLSDHMLDHPPCIEFNPTRAKELLTGTESVPKLTFGFSRMGGDDVAQTMQWFQGQWKKHLNLSVELFGEEQIVYLQHLRAKPPVLFRKGVSLDRPTCLAALELFTRGHPENYIRLDEDKYEQLVQNLRRAHGEPARHKACREAVTYLVEGYRLIPLGKIFFAYLAKSDFQGWDLNELNQLDLTNLERKSSPP